MYSDNSCINPPSLEYYVNIRYKVRGMTKTDVQNAQSAQFKVGNEKKMPSQYVPELRAYMLTLLSQLYIEALPGTAPS